jgi:hypothetical protein
MLEPTDICRHCQSGITLIITVDFVGWFHVAPDRGGHDVVVESCNADRVGKPFAEPLIM